MIELGLELAKAWEALGQAGLVILGIICFVAPLAFIPRSALCLVGGFVFGMATFPVALAASTAGATLAMLLSRHLFQDRFLGAIRARPLTSALASAVDAEGWRIVALLRLASPVPGTPMNYLFGLTQIPSGPYTWGTAVGNAVPTLCFTYIGAASRTVLDQDLILDAQRAFLALAAAVAALVLCLVGRRARRILAQGRAARADSVA